MNPGSKTVLLVFMLLSIGCHRNQAPQVASVISLTDTIVGASEVTFVVNATDNEGDILTYSWSASGGLFLSETTSDSVVWQAPTNISDESYTITVQVSDGEYSGSGHYNAVVEGSLFIDKRDGYIYQFVQIGDQVWLAENLAFLPEVCEADQGSVNEPCYYVYGYDGSSVTDAQATSNYETYGVLYNWEAARISCPQGWRLPSDDDWKVLETSLGMNESDANTIDWRISGLVGGKLKEEGTNHWLSTSSHVNNRSGFTALPGGNRSSYGSRFVLLGSSAHFWTSTENGWTSAWRRLLRYNEAGVNRNVINIEDGFSVRCLKE